MEQEIKIIQTTGGVMIGDTFQNAPKYTVRTGDGVYTLSTHHAAEALRYIRLLGNKGYKVMAESQQVYNTLLTEANRVGT